MLLSVKKLRSPVRGVSPHLDFRKLASGLSSVFPRHFLIHRIKVMSEDATERTPLLNGRATHSGENDVVLLDGQVQETQTSDVTKRGASPRRIAPDLLRGLLMILMALDHVSVSKCILLDDLIKGSMVFTSRSVRLSSWNKHRRRTGGSPISRLGLKLSLHLEDLNSPLCTRIHLTNGYGYSLFRDKCESVLT